MPPSNEDTVASSQPTTARTPAPRRQDSCAPPPATRTAASRPRPPVRCHWPPETHAVPHVRARTAPRPPATSGAVPRPAPPATCAARLPCPPRCPRCGAPAACAHRHGRPARRRAAPSCLTSLLFLLRIFRRRQRKKRRRRRKIWGGSHLQRGRRQASTATCRECGAGGRAPALYSRTPGRPRGRLQRQRLQRAPATRRDPTNGLEQLGQATCIPQIVCL
ncbi:hypothetical protein U9M48_001695 [Paspalum notatum var. saurae]|uniref:Uncharacterized protein n=1 Tax=Paspalum notatum var. saurae TaxID=547442 RepID=A0AAQ3PMF3_PASNO